MPPKYGLSDAEYLVMEMIWNAKVPLSFSEIENYFSNHTDKEWKKQTLHTYLTRLIKKGALAIDRQGNKNIYKPAMPKADYVSRWTHSFLEESFDGSLMNFMCALTGNTGKLSQEDIEELRKYLDE